MKGTKCQMNEKVEIGNSEFNIIWFYEKKVLLKWTNELSVSQRPVWKMI